MAQGVFVDKGNCHMAESKNKKRKRTYQKAVSLYPLSLEEAVSRLLKAKPISKKETAAKRKPRQKAGQ